METSNERRDYYRRQNPLVSMGHWAHCDGIRWRYD
nr:MAG TPA: hypothetical protein [Caudoviricetes sp.]